MKKLLIPVLCLLLALLCACGKTPTPVDADGSTAADVSTTAEEEVSWDDGDFLYVKGDLPKGWTISDIYSTSTFLEATYGEGENAPKLTVSVMTYDDDMGASKTKLLADKVHEREQESASEVKTQKIGGLNFYTMSYNSLVTEKTRCYVFFGQNEPDAKTKEYKFVEIQLDNVKDAKQYDSLKGVLDTLEFKF